MALSIATSASKKRGLPYVTRTHNLWKFRKKYTALHSVLSNERTSMLRGYPAKYITPYCEVLTRANLNAIKRQYIDFISQHSATKTQKHTQTTNIAKNKIRKIRN